jgi:GxxExxY protein
MLHEELTGDVIGAAMEVLNELRPGLDEKLYENALVIELTERGHRVSQRSRFDVQYKVRLVGVLIPDLIVDDVVLLDVKVASDVCDAHISQLIGYLAKTGLQVGLLINFKHASLKWKRVSR